MAAKLPNGSADALITRGLDELRSVVELWRSRVLDAIGAATSVDDVPRRVLTTVGQLPTEDLARAVWRLRMQTCMLGALDSHWETTTDHEVEPQMASRFWSETADNFPGLSPGSHSATTNEGLRTFAAADGGTSNPLPGAHRIGGFGQKPFDEALDLFREKQILTKGEWLRLDDEQKRNSFFVSRLAKRDTIRLVHDELVTSLQEGVKVSEFKDRLKTSFEEKGLSPLSDAHATTIVRTNIATAYGDGRKAQQSSAVVSVTHPYWLMGGVSDSTTRATHSACFGISLPNDDPFWSRCYAPNGCRCRCRVTARREGSGAGSSTYPQLSELPDDGWTGGGGPVAVSVPAQIAPKAPPPAQSPTPTPEPAKPKAVEPPPPPIQEGVHFLKLTSTVGPKRVEALLQHVHENAPVVTDFLARQPLKELEVRKSIRSVNGTYAPMSQTIQITADRKAGSFGKPFVSQGSFSVSSAGATKEEAAARTIVHEIGHHVHLHDAGYPTTTFTAVDDEVKQAFAAGRGTAITRYAQASKNEFFAESFAAYFFHRAELIATSPRAYAMVERVLKLRGVTLPAMP